MIFEHNNSSAIINDVLVERMKVNPLYSYHAFAKKIGISQSYLSLLLNQKRKLTIKTAQKIANQFAWSDLENEYFELIVKRELSKTIEVNEYYQKEINRFKKKHSNQLLSLKKFCVIQDWYYSAILECVLMTQNSKEQDIDLWAKYLNVRPLQLKKSLKKLEALDFIYKKNNHYYRNDQGVIETPSDFASDALKNFHKQILQKAITAIDQQTIDQRSFSGMTMAINTKKLPDAKKKIKNFIAEMSELLEVDKKDDIYQLHISLFSLFYKQKANIH